MKTKTKLSRLSPAKVTLKCTFSLTVLFCILTLTAFAQTLPPRDNSSIDDSFQASYLTQKLISLANEFKHGASSGGQSVLEQLRITVVERQQLLTKMLESDPARVNPVTVPESVKIGLPKEIQNKIEQRVNINGEFSMVYEDSPSRSNLRYFLKANGKQYSLHFSDKLPTEFKTGDHVSVSGVELNYQLLVNSLDSAATTTSASGPQMVTNDSFGEHKLLVILVNFQDKQTQPVTPTQIHNTLITTSDYFREASYGQTWLNSDILGWFTIPISSTTCDTAAISNYAQQAATAAGANLANYGHYVYAFPANACSFAGMGSVGGNPSQAWLNGWFDLQEFGHELGHNFGLFHSRSMDCGTTVVGSNCTTSEYGDQLDFMGSASSAHYNIFQKERLGWVNFGSSPSLTTVATSGNYWIDSYEGASSNPKGLKILKSTDPTTGARTWYYVERRSAYGFDSWVSGNSNVSNGVVVHQGSESSGQSIYLLDLTPATSSWMDPALTAGQSFFDPDANITITTLFADSTGAMVSVSFGPQQCITANPTVTLSQAQGTLVQAGTAVNYTVTVTNNDSVVCNATNYNLQASVPSGWLASLAPVTLSVNPGASVTATLQVTSPSNAASGTYNVGMTASNDTQPAYFGSGSGTYVVSSPPSITVSSNQASYSRNQTATVTASVSADGAAVVGASVSFTMTRSNGSSVTGIATTGSTGLATFKYTLRKKDPVGTYQVLSKTTANGVAASATTSFVVK